MPLSPCPLAAWQEGVTALLSASRWGDTETAKLLFLLKGEKLHYLTEDEIAELGGGY